MERISDLRLFLNVANEGNFTKAARLTGITGPMATKKIASLEEQLKVRLFNRTTRQVSLTEAGSVFREYAQQIADTAENAKDAISEMGAGPHGKLRVTASPTMAKLLVKYSTEFLERYPEIGIGFNFTDQMVDLVKDGFDLAIRVGHAKDSSLIAKKLAVTNSVVCASPKYLTKYGTPKTPMDLEKHNCILLRDRIGSKVWKFSKGTKHYSSRIKGSLTVNSGDAILDGVLNHAGIAMGPAWLVDVPLKEGLLIPLLEDYEIEPKGTVVNAVYPSRSYLPQKIRVLIDFLSKKFKQDFG